MTATWRTLIPENPSDPVGVPLETRSAEHPNLLRNSVGSTSANHLSKGPRYNRVSCGEQLWRFYSGRVVRKKKHENRRRIFFKSGEVNSEQINVEEKGQRFIGDLFTTLVDARWRVTLFIFSISYFLSWLGFATIWWVIFSAHGDLANFGDPDWKPCVVGVRSFTSVFLFSLETQHTIGYGYHHMTDNCPEAIAVLCAQSIAGVLLEALMVGVVFAKLSRPKKRSQTLIFSRHAVICQRDGQLCLMFRVGDMRKSHILEAHIRAQVITKRTTAEGEVIPIHQEEIKVGGFGEDEDRILLFWPTTIVHPIDSESPLYSMSANELLKAKLEVIVVMEGVVESTGMTTQARTSFLPNEILWGHRFHQLTSYKSETGHHMFDFAFFHSTFPVETPLCSAQDLDHIRDLKAEGLSGREIISSLGSSKGVTTTTTATATTSPPGSTSDNEKDQVICAPMAILGDLLEEKTGDGEDEKCNKPNRAPLTAFNIIQGEEESDFDFEEDDDDYNESLRRNMDICLNSNSSDSVTSESNV